MVDLACIQMRLRNHFLPTVIQKKAAPYRARITALTVAGAIDCPLSSSKGLRV